MNATISVSWSTVKGDSSALKFSRNYGELTQMERLDFLQDALGMITSAYDSELKNLFTHRYDNAS